MSREAWIICDRCGKRERSESRATPSEGDGVSWGRITDCTGNPLGDFCAVCVAFITRLTEPANA